MATLTSQDAQTDFATLGPRMSLFTPSEYKPGELIILCTWLGAGKKHILKYVNEYKTIAPKAKILLIQSSVYILTTTYVKQRVIIQPAAQIVRAALEECRNVSEKSSLRPKIMLHTFSNGGTNSATQLLLVLQSQLKAPLPLRGIVCDSGPAQGSYWKDYHSMLTSLPKGFIWTIVGHPLIFMTCNVLFGSQLLGWEKPEDIYRRSLLDAELVDCGRICYIFSETDTHVDVEDVVTHAEIAEGKGWEVEKVMFTDSPHCNHISKYRAEYVGALKRSWAEGPHVSMN